VISEILINGAPSDGKIPVTDSSVLRGDGCFEVIRSYAGRPFALEEHLDRLQRSAAALDIALPPRSEIAGWIEKIASAIGNGAVRVVVTRGSSVPGLDEPSNVVVFGHRLDEITEPARLHPIEAPWHAAGIAWDLAGAKTISYAPNMAATRRARHEGYEDALLLTSDGVVLEGPTFAVGWVVDGELETPGLDLGILDSITRRIVLGLAVQLRIPVVEGRWGLGRLDDASEVTAWSTVREVQPVGAVGERAWEPGPVTRRLREAFDERVRGSGHD
jgi:branched-subunit amino acid aminotransferase/4-amino-4-deoxychorismate lyase